MTGGKKTPTGVSEDIEDIEDIEGGVEGGVEGVDSETPGGDDAGKAGWLAMGKGWTANKPIGLGTTFDDGTRAPLEASGRFGVRSRDEIGPEPFGTATLTGLPIWDEG
jgi:hypothetical protein